MSVCLKKETLLALVDRELPSGEIESAERHAAGCALCQQELKGIRATSLQVNVLLRSLSPEDAINDAAGTEPITVLRIPYKGANARMRWTAVASLGVLVAASVVFVMIRRTHSAAETDVVRTVAPAPVPTVEPKDILAAAVTTPAHARTPKAHARARQFQALDDGEPIETGMIYRVSLPASSSSNSTVLPSAKRIPAEVIVDEFGKVRAIRFLQ